MIINEIIGNISNLSIIEKQIDYLDLEWYECSKRIQRKKTRSGTDLAVKFLKEGQRLREGDILFEDEEKIIVVNVLKTEAIVMNPHSMMQMGTLCYEIGNKHIPLFIQNGKVLVPFEMPIYRWLEVSGFAPRKEATKLLNLLKSNVAPHGHDNSESSLFTKILKMASGKDE